MLLGVGGGVGVGVGGFLLGLASYFEASGARLKEASQAPAFLSTLEWAVAWCGVGSLGFLVGFGSLVVLLRELAEESARRQRGEVR